VAASRIWAFLGVVTLAVAISSATYSTPGGDALYYLTYLAVTVAGWLAVRRVEPGPDRLPWVLVAVTLTLWLTGDLIEGAYWYLRGTVPGTGVADSFWLGGYVVLAVALTLMARRRAPGRMRSAVLDGLTLTVAAGMAVWQFLIVSTLGDGFSTLDVVVPALYPVADVVLLAAILFIALSPGDRTASTRLVLGAVLLFLVIDLGYNVLPHFVDYSLVQRIAPLIMLGNALLVAACLHPERAELTRPGRHANLLHPSRVIFLGLAFLTAPTLTLFESGLSSNAVVALLATALTTAFILTRFTIAVREQEKAQRLLAEQARRDPLTGLANRSVLSAEMQRVLPGRDDPVAVLYLDLDGFKTVNDRHGHEAGDLVLSVVAQRLSAAVRGSDLVVRLGGDEFVLLCPALPEPEAIGLAERVLRDVAAPIVFRGQTLDIGASVGIAAYGPESAAGDNEMLRTADEAMYEAKRQGRGCWVLAGLEKAQSTR
jgi:diguanylate cyclase (GGDEF)-like protein